MITRRYEVGERVTVARAAEILQVSRPYIYKLITANALKTEKYGPRTILVLRESLLEWLRARGAYVDVQEDLLTITEARVPLPMERIREFCRRWRIIEFALFGSVLRETFRPDSDVDVLVTFAPDAPATLFTLPKMAEELENIFGRDIDLVSRRGLEQSQNALRRDDILRSAEVIYHAAA